MEAHALRQMSLRSFVGFLILSAIIAIATVLDDDFDIVHLKILATTFTIASASICAMACAAHLEKYNQKTIALAGISSCTVGAVLIVIGMWSEFSSTGYWQTTISVIVVAVAIAHSLVLWLPRMPDKQKWIQKTGSVATTALALLLVIGVWREDAPSLYLKLVAISAILTGLCTITLPIMIKLHGTTEQESPEQPAPDADSTLVLTQLTDDIYQDCAGNQYNVLPLEELLPLESDSTRRV